VPPFGPIGRWDLIEALRRTGFAGPYAGGRHEFMTRGRIRLIVPNPHRGDVDRGLLARILREAGVSREEWEAL
jgi:predicted RNA binding protein YcfA (HicA-like mRNA interferase family)